MDAEESCYFCGNSDEAARLVPWFVQVERRSIHMPCWLTAYRTGDPEAKESAPTDVAA
jgi:hypothetical protein